MMRQARPREYRQVPGYRPIKANAIAELVRSNDGSPRTGAANMSRLASCSSLAPAPVASS